MARTFSLTYRKMRKPARYLCCAGGHKRGGRVFYALAAPAPGRVTGCVIHGATSIHVPVNPAMVGGANDFLAHF